MARAYELRRRAESQAETRRRIVEAAIDLHRTVGPASTKVSDIAQRAGVGRVTVYRHFPEEAVLARACSGLYFERHPPPDPARWRDIPDAETRLRSALREVYAYHAATEDMMTRVLADARDHEVVAPYHAHWRRAADILVQPYRARGRRRRLLRAGIGVALAFDTWRALARDQGLTQEQAVEVALRLAAAG
jgi:AcrR family transcriptional regulator